MWLWRWGYSNLEITCDHKVNIFIMKLQCILILAYASWDNDNFLSQFTFDFKHVFEWMVSSWYFYDFFRNYFCKHAQSVLSFIFNLVNSSNYVTMIDMVFVITNSDHLLYKHIFIIIWYRWFTESVLEWFCVPIYSININIAKIICSPRK